MLSRSATRGTALGEGVRPPRVPRQPVEQPGPTLLLDARRDDRISVDNDISLKHRVQDVLDALKAGQKKAGRVRRSYAPIWRVAGRLARGGVYFSESDMDIGGKTQFTHEPHFKEMTEALIELIDYIEDHYKKDAETASKKAFDLCRKALDVPDGDERELLLEDALVVETRKPVSQSQVFLVMDDLLRHFQAKSYSITLEKIKQEWNKAIEADKSANKMTPLQYFAEMNARTVLKMTAVKQELLNGGFSYRKDDTEKFVAEFVERYVKTYLDMPNGAQTTQDFADYYTYTAMESFARMDTDGPGQWKFITSFLLSLPSGVGQAIVADVTARTEVMNTPEMSAVRGKARGRLDMIENFIFLDNKQHGQPPYSLERFERALAGDEELQKASPLLLNAVLTYEHEYTLLGPDDGRRMLTLLRMKYRLDEQEEPESQPASKRARTRGWESFPDVLPREQHELTQDLWHMQSVDAAGRIADELKQDNLFADREEESMAALRHAVYHLRQNRSLARFALTVGARFYAPVAGYHDSTHLFDLLARDIQNKARSSLATAADLAFEYVLEAMPHSADAALIDMKDHFAFILRHETDNDMDAVRKIHGFYKCDSRVKSIETFLSEASGNPYEGSRAVEFDALKKWCKEWETVHYAEYGFIVTPDTTAEVLIKVAKYHDHEENLHNSDYLARAIANEAIEMNRSIGRPPGDARIMQTNFPKERFVGSEFLRLFCMMQRHDDSKKIQAKAASLLAEQAKKSRERDEAEGQPASKEARTSGGLTNLESRRHFNTRSDADEEHSDIEQEARAIVDELATANRINGRNEVAMAPLRRARNCMRAGFQFTLLALNRPANTFYPIPGYEYVTERFCDFARVIQRELHITTVSAVYLAFQYVYLAMPYQGRTVARVDLMDRVSYMQLKDVPENRDAINFIHGFYHRSTFSESIRQFIIDAAGNPYTGERAVLFKDLVKWIQDWEALHYSLGFIVNLQTTSTVLLYVAADYDTIAPEPDLKRPRLQGRKKPKTRGKDGKVLTPGEIAIEIKRINESLGYPACYLAPFRRALTHLRQKKADSQNPFLKIAMEFNNYAVQQMKETGDDDIRNVLVDVIAALGRDDDEIVKMQQYGLYYEEIAEQVMRVNDQVKNEHYDTDGFCRAVKSVYEGDFSDYTGSRRDRYKQCARAYIALQNELERLGYMVWYTDCDEIKAILAKKKAESS